MAEATGINTRRDLEVTIVKKALADATFRAALATNAREAVERTLAEQTPGAHLPANLQVVAIQEPPNAFYIVIPHVPATAELSDTDLEKVAGGMMDAIGVSVSWSR